MCRKRKPVLIGLCGRSGAGKGYVSRMFADFGIPAIDTDGVYRELTSPREAISPCMAELCDAFGPSVRKPDNSLDRGVMRSLVFGEENKSNLQKLNEITHRHILADTLRRVWSLFEEGFTHILIDAPLLFESGFNELCEAVVCVTAPEEVHIRRIMERDGIDEESAKLRLASQSPVETLTARADIVIANDTDKETLRCRVKDAAAKLKNIGKEEKSE